MKNIFNDEYINDIIGEFQNVLKECYFDLITKKTKKITSSLDEITITGSKSVEKIEIEITMKRDLEKKE